MNSEIFIRVVILLGVEPNYENWFEIKATNIIAILSDMDFSKLCTMKSY